MSRAVHDLKYVVAATSLNAMFDKGWFSICTIDNVAKALGVRPDPECYALLHPLHCVNFNAMPRDLQEQIVPLIKQCLSGDPSFQFERIELAPLVIPQPQPQTRAGALAEAKKAWWRP